ncbi:uncharacterized protein LOC131301576 isoform X2 [Rhododendron vialii]|uniref:uncharacterized protein LOC131301576 isoform X1 n=1 Tax=Rhododendron vialii TaxID=182163 RepID=UPI00265E59FB|nr:uncharacterized protein LOC131301576 isoform X1 [Rhododendron vialii]XP_058183919.1 uncharacterized protein LOC131301576 isoform X2 [Rhododendron vialii]
MESAALLRSLNCSVGSLSHVQSILKRPCMVALHNVSSPTLSKSRNQSFALGGKLASPIRQEGMTVSCANTLETTSMTMSDDGVRQGSHNKNPLPRATFPSGFEALILEVCDETEVAELKLKVGDFEMHLKRNIGAAEVPMAVDYLTTYAPVSSSPTSEAAPAPSLPPPPPPPPLPPKSSTEKMSPFVNVSAEQSAKLAALEASGCSEYVFVKSPKVGSFQRSRTHKGVRKPLNCKEGDVIREGQVICYVDQFGTVLPVRSDVDGEVLKYLFNEGDPVGYGDPIMAVLPSFHDIE